MDITTLIADRTLLSHPFYRRWEDGLLIDGELASYAAQYRFFEAQLPGFLKALTSMVEGDAKSLVKANLADEVDGPTTHLELFDRFAAAVAAPAEEISPAMEALVAVYADAIASGDADFALGVLAGYEVQASEVADTKGAGLSEHYGVTGEGLEFWHIHAELEKDHAAWVLEAAAAAESDRVIAGAHASSAAWWAYLDEREALVAA